MANKLTLCYNKHNLFHILFFLYGDFVCREGNEGGKKGFKKKAEQQDGKIGASINL